MINLGKVTDKVHVDCTACDARLDGLCQGSGPEVQSVIASYKSGDRTIRAGQDIFAQGEGCNSIYNLIRGWVILYSLLEDGQRQILQFALPGTVLGLQLFGGATATYGAQALTDTIVCEIPHKALEPLSKKHPEIGLRLALLVARDRTLAYDHLSSVGRRTAHQRVAHLILELYIRYRAQWPGIHLEEMQLPLTQEHIGDATGLTGVHVNRVLHDLRDEGMIAFHYRRLTIIDPDKLLDAADIDPQLAQSWMARPPRI